MKIPTQRPPVSTLVNQSWCYGNMSIQFMLRERLGLTATQVSDISATAASWLGGRGSGHPCVEQ